MRTYIISFFAALLGFLLAALVTTAGIHLYRDHLFIHWLAVSIEQQQKASKPTTP